MDPSVSQNEQPKNNPQPVISDLPPYSQHLNGCGLSSLLMLMNLPQHPEIEQFLTKIWQKISPVFKGVKYNRPELEWTIAMQYVLLKILAYAQKDELYQFFNDRLEYTFEDQRIMHKFNVDNERQKLLTQKKLPEAFTYLHYLEDHDYITPVLLKRQLNTMKTDIELKILAELFNYKFVFQECEDMTGAIYFIKEELNGKSANTMELKWKTLEDASNDPNKVILWGMHHHWLAVRGIYQKLPSESEQKKEKKAKEWDSESYILEVNDPASTNLVQLNFKYLKLTDRFYIFEHRSDTNYKIFDKILTEIEPDIPEEMQRYRNYLKERQLPITFEEPTKNNDAKMVLSEKATLDMKQEAIKAVEAFATKKQEATQIGQGLKPSEGKQKKKKIKKENKEKAMDPWA